jgi:hypothetical protein
MSLSKLSKTDMSAKGNIKNNAASILSRTDGGAGCSPKRLGDGLPGVNMI